MWSTQRRHSKGLQAPNFRFPKRGCPEACGKPPPYQSAYPLRTIQNGGQSHFRVVLRKRDLMVNIDLKDAYFLVAM